MKISKHAWETWWRHYMFAAMNFGVMNIYWHRHIPIKRIEIKIHDN